MTGWRRATAADASELRDLERVANLEALGHVFPPADFPFPGQEVLERWRTTLADPGVVVEVLDGDAGLRAFAAYDSTTLRHLAVHPDDRGTGLARTGVERAGRRDRRLGRRQGPPVVSGGQHPSARPLPAPGLATDRTAAPGGVAAVPR